jgi:GNAT superfamily N-acetyltransferase
MPSGVSIRFAALDDLPWCTETDPHIGPDTHRRKIELGEVILAIAGERIIGCLRLEYLWSLVPYISVIYVWEDHQRRGVGRALVQFAGQFLLDRGHNTLYSSSEAASPAPQAWHRALGFQECGFIAGINDGGVGEVFFRLDLTSA